MDTFKRGDYVEGLAVGFYPGMIWIVVATEGERVACKRPFSLIKLPPQEKFAVISGDNSFYQTDCVWFSIYDVRRYDPARLMRAKLSGCKIPTLEDI